MAERFPPPESGGEGGTGVSSEYHPADQRGGNEANRYPHLKAVARQQLKRGLIIGAETLPPDPEGLVGGPSAQQAIRELKPRFDVDMRNQHNAAAGLAALVGVVRQVVTSDKFRGEFNSDVDATRTRQSPEYLQTLGEALTRHIAAYSRNLLSFEDRQGQE